MMKKWAEIGEAIVLFLFSALLIALSACGLSTENEFCSEGDDPEVTIRHFELDSGNENVEFFYEIPHMEGITPAAKRFNDFFDALYADFMATEPEKVRELLDAAVPGRPSAEDPYRYCWQAEVQEVSSDGSASPCPITGIWAEFGITGSTDIPSTDAPASGFSWTTYCRDRRK